MHGAEDSGGRAGRRVARVAAVVAAGCSVILLPVSCRPAEEVARQMAEKRQTMVDHHLRGRGLTNEAVLAAMGRVPREDYVLDTHRRHAYADSALPIDHGQTISQPFIVAAMTEAIDPQPGDRVLEVGTGSGYQAAVLAELVAEVYTIEIVEALAESAAARLVEKGYTNVTVRAGDGYVGWPEKQPFDGIVVTAAPDHVPQPLIDQLKPGGHLVIPVGDYPVAQELVLLTRKEDGTVTRQTLMGVRFVPFTGEHVKRRAAE